MKRQLVMPAALVTVTFLAGCAIPATPQYDAGFGESVRQARALQVINPAASSNTDPVAGIDGEAGQEAIGRYHDSFRAPPSTFSVLGIGEQSLKAGQGQ